MRPSFVGVVHLRPCPSSSRAVPGSFDEVFDAAMADARAMAEGGVDGVIVENFGDAPFHKGTVADPVPPDVPAALAVVARAIRVELGLDVGINCLRNDGVAAVGAAAVAGARWVRVNALTGAYVTDQGVIDGDAARVAAFRKRVGHSTLLLADLFVKHAAPLAAMDPETSAKDLAQRSGADALVITGSRTGASVDVDFLDTVRGAVGGFPVWIGSGVSPENIDQLRDRCDGMIVGTALKHGGQVHEPVDPARVARLRQALNAAP